MTGDQIDSLLPFSRGFSNSIFQRHHNDHIYYVYKNNIYLLNTFLLLVIIWRVFGKTRKIGRTGKTLENLTRDAREITKNYALWYKSTQVAFARFLEDNTNQENRYVINIKEDSQQNEDDNDAEKEIGVESVGGRSLKLWEKTDSGIWKYWSEMAYVFS